MDLFWLHKDQIKAMGLSVGFKVFSTGHLIWLAAIAARAQTGPAAEYGLVPTKRDKNEKGDHIIPQGGLCGAKKAIY